MKTVYIAGVLNAMAVDYIKNMHRMMLNAETIRQRGYAVYIPCADVLIGMMFGNWGYKDYFENNIAWLEKSDAVYVCPNSDKSEGVKKEIERAGELDIPVVYRVDDLEDVLYDRISVSLKKGHEKKAGVNDHPKRPILNIKLTG